MDVFEAIRQLMAPPEEKKKRAIGFVRDTFEFLLHTSTFIILRKEGNQWE